MAQIIDAHQYFWNIRRFKYPWMKCAPRLLQRDFFPDDIRPELEKTGVESTIIIQAQPTLALEQTCWLLELAEAEDFIDGVVGWVDPADPNVDQFLTMIDTRPLLRGVCYLVQNQKDSDWQVREDVIEGLAAVAKHGLTYDFLLPRQIGHLPVLAQRVPDLKIVIDHVARPPIKKGSMEQWFAGLKAAASFPNVYCKLSGLITAADWRNWKADDLRPCVEKAIELFGPERLMSGSDWPFCLLAGSYERVYEALATTLDQLSESERECVYSKTARSFYGIVKTLTQLSPAKLAEGVEGNNG